MCDLHILNYRLVESVPSEKPHYVYTVDLQVGGRHRCVERRYSQFHSLHRQLRKEFQTPTFPPKRVRCTQPRLLEQRRRGLELYLQTMFQHSSPSRFQVLGFLGLEHYKVECENEGNGKTNEECESEHHPIYVFRQDPYLKHESESVLPDVVVNGMLMALYGTHSPL